MGVVMVRMLMNLLAICLVVNWVSELVYKMVIV